MKANQDYYSYIMSKEWQAKKQALYEDIGYKCFFCGQRRALDAHHITYENFTKEKKGDLVWLCRFHHRWLHSFLGGPLRQILSIYRFIKRMGVL